MVSRGDDDEERSHTSDISMTGEDYGQVVHGGDESEGSILEHQSILYTISGVQMRKKSCQGRRVLTCTTLSIKWRLGDILGIDLAMCY